MSGSPVTVLPPAAAFLALLGTPKKAEITSGGKSTPRESGPSKRRKPVIGTNRDTGKVTVFVSVTAAAKALGVSGSSVANACHRHNRTVKGHTLMYQHPSADDVSRYERSIAVAEERQKNSPLHHTNKPRAVFSVDARTNRRRNYKTIASAACAAGCTPVAILQSINYPGRRKAKGRYWYEAT